MKNGDSADKMKMSDIARSTLHILTYLFLT